MGTYDYNVLTSDPMSKAPIGACNHIISFERMVVNQNDFRTLNYAGNTTLNMRGPINGSTNVQIWISGEEIFSDDPVYGWQVVIDPNRIDTSIPAGIFYKIVFNQSVRLVIPLIEVSYITIQGFCLKCSATGYVNDLKPSTSGNFLHISGASKLVQKSFKWILTSMCPFYPTFICQIKNYLGRKLGAQITDTDIQTEVVNTLSTMQQVQQAQGTVQSLDPQEILKDIINVVAIISPTDPTTILLTITVSNYSGQTVPMNFELPMN